MADRVGSTVTLVKDVTIKKPGDAKTRIFRRGAKPQVMKDHGRYGVDVKHPTRFRSDVEPNPTVRILEHEIHHTQRWIYTQFI